MIKIKTDPDHSYGMHFDGLEQSQLLNKQTYMVTKQVFKVNRMIDVINDSCWAISNQSHYLEKQIWDDDDDY